MPKPAPELLDPARYPHHCRLEPRFCDLDTNLHVNNVALADLLQEGRVRFHRASEYDRALRGMSAMTVSFSVEYLGQVYYPEPIDVHTGALDVGRTSHTMGQLVLQGGRPVAFARTVVVCVRDDRPAENCPEFVETVRQWMVAA